MFATRFSHCVEKDKKRPTYFFRDRGEIALEEGDSLIIFSVSGEDFPLNAAKIGGNKEQMLLVLLQKVLL